MSHHPPGGDSDASPAAIDAALPVPVRRQDLMGNITAQEPGLRGNRFPAQARVLSGSANGVFVTIGGVAGEDPLPGSADVEDLHASGSGWHMSYASLAATTVPGSSAAP
jgi:hypothetical protein